MNVVAGPSQPGFANPRQSDPLLQPLRLKKLLLRNRVVSTSHASTLDDGGMYTGSQILLRAVAELAATGIVVALARLSDERAQAQAHRTGLIEAIGPDRVFMSVDEAVRKLGPDVTSRPRNRSHPSPLSTPERPGGAQNDPL